MVDYLTTNELGVGAAVLALLVAWVALLTRVFRRYP